MEISVTTDDLTTVADAAKKLNVAPMTIYRWVKEGKILAIKLNSYTFIPVSEVTRLTAK